MNLVLRLLVTGAGLFTMALGAVHFFLPLLLDYKTVILERPRDWKAPRPFRVWLTRYVVTPGDRYGVVWVMNHAASYALVSIGLVDLLAADWLRSEPGRFLALWIAGWWLLRATAQRYFGRRVGDWLIMAWFAALGLLHIWLALS